MMNLLVTGIPRAGTTLLVHLLNQAENVLALHEPIAPEMFQKCVDSAQAVDIVTRAVDDLRRSALDHGVVVTKQAAGQVPANPVAPSVEGALRQEQVTLAEIPVGRPLSADFRLIVKHNALFTALLSQLTHFEIFAVVRNPLAVLLSWDSVNLPVNQGRIPMGERFDTALHQHLNATEDNLDRQLILLKWFFDHYRALPAERVIRYEEVVASDGSNLAPLMGQHFSSAQPLHQQIGNQRYSRETLRRLCDRLAGDAALFSGFYSPDDVTRLAVELGA